MVAQVGSADLAAQRREGEHLVPQDPHVVEAPTEGLMAGDRAHAVVVDEEAHGDTACLRASQGLVQGGRVFVPGCLEIQDVDVMGGLVDAVGHRAERLGRVVVEVADAAHRRREPGQVARQSHDGRGVVVRADGQTILTGLHVVGLGLRRGRAGHDGVDELSCLRVVVEAASHRPPGSENEVERHTHERREKNQHQPRVRGRRAPVLGNNAQRDGADGELESPEEEPGPQRGIRMWRHHVPILPAAPGPVAPTAANAARRSARRARWRGFGVPPRRGRRSTRTGRPRPRGHHSPR